jgi:hypothetical protein
LPLCVGEREIGCGCGFFNLGHFCLPPK